MATCRIFDRYLAIEARNGTGLDIEFADTRPCWVTTETGWQARAFRGLVIQIPFFIIVFGKILDDFEVEGYYP